MKSSALKIAAGVMLLACMSGLFAQDHKVRQRNVPPAKTEQKDKDSQDSLVRLLSAQSVQLLEKGGNKYRKVVGPARFLHNNTYLVCDTALWNVDTKVINAWGHVQIIQQRTVLSSEKLVYLIDDDLAQFRGNLVQLQDKDGNTLRTKYLDYNTKDSVAVFSRGGAMKDKDGDVMESLDGTYDAKIKQFTFSKNVNMYSDTIYVNTKELVYHSQQDLAVFDTPIDAWKRDDMLSAHKGWYDKGREIFFFNENVHMQSPTREGWADTLYFYQKDNNVEMLGSAELYDSDKEVVGMADRITYDDSLAIATFKGNAGIVAVSDNDDKKDTVYVGADTLIYRSVKKNEVDSLEKVQSAARLADINTDPVAEYRRQAYEAAQEAAKKKAEEAEKDKAKQQTSTTEDSAERTKRTRQRRDQGSSATAPVQDTTATPVKETAAEPVMQATADTTRLETPDTTAVPTDTLNIVSSDTLSVTIDTSKIGFALGKGNVRLLRSDVQVKCDSLQYSDLDSLARLYKNPIIWNNGDRQYSADSVTLMIKDGRLKKASLMSNAFVIIQEEEDLFDQIRGAEILAFFDTSMTLERFDALGGANAMFYLQENGTFATVNKSECKMMTANFKDGDIESVYYFDSPKNDAYPIVQLPKADRQMKGFNWTPDDRPASKESVIPHDPRESQRAEYDERPRGKFKQMGIYFPGYMEKLEKQLSERKPAAEQKPADITPEAAPVESVDTSQVIQITDSIVPKDSTTGTDSIMQTAADTTSVTSAPAKAKKELTAEQLKEKQKRDEAAAKKKAKADAAAAKKAAQAVKDSLREAKWAMLDSLDAVKAEIKAQKALEKKREKTYKALLRAEKEKAREDKIRNRYILKYSKRKAREEGK